MPERASVTVTSWEETASRVAVTVATPPASETLAGATLNVTSGTQTGLGRFADRLCFGYNIIPDAPVLQIGARHKTGTSRRGSDNGWGAAGIFPEADATTPRGMQSADGIVVRFTDNNVTSSASGVWFLAVSVGSARGPDGRAYPWGNDPPTPAHAVFGLKEGSDTVSAIGNRDKGRSPYGVHDLAGNLYEWTTDWYVPRHPDEVVKACCTPSNPRGPQEADSYDPRQPAIRIPRKVIKGGSHLCAPNYCRRYRPAARFPEPVDTSACHLGFRCIVRTERDPDVRPRE